MQDQWRVIELAGVHNFRDYGGYAVGGGGHLRRGVLWRSGQHHDASDADLDRIAALDVATVFDLRFDAERASHPCRRPVNFTGRVLFSDEAGERAGEAQAAPHVAAARAARGRDAATMRAMMMHNYTTIPFRPLLVQAIRRYFSELSQTSAPSLVNCMAGKDRTGVAVALLQRAVGVHRDDVMADYLLTNTAGNVEARIAAGATVLADRAGPMEPGALRVIMSVEPEYLDSAFAMITERYGSEDAYLEQVLCADAALREKLRERLVA